MSRAFRLFNVSSSRYHEWIKNPVSTRKKRDNELKDKIKQSFADSYEIYGSPRIHADLKAQGEAVSRKRIARLMREESLIAKVLRAFKRTTQSNSEKPLADNLLKQNFSAESPNKRWVSDITYIRTDEGWLYLAVIMDLYSRIIVGWAMDKQMTTELISEALMMGLSRRNVGEGLLIHSDQGTQYTSKDYQQHLKDNNVTCSLSGVGRCYDNAAMESFFHSLKTEWVYHQRYSNRNEAKSSIFEYIEVFYNQNRRHSYTDQLSPSQFEEKMKAA